MTRQYRINQIIDAVKYIGTNLAEVQKLKPNYMPREPNWGDEYEYIFKTPTNKVFVMPVALFEALFTEVTENQ
jgi:hypothetical protein